MDCTVVPRPGHVMTLEEAVALARRAHGAVLDRSGQPFIGHPLRVMASVEGLHAKMAAVLHDVVENTPVSLSDLRRLGCPAEVVAAVDALTQRPGEPLADYWARVRVNPVAHTVKLADIGDNSRPDRLRYRPHARALRQAAKYVLALRALGAPEQSHTAPGLA